MEIWRVCKVCILHFQTPNQCIAPLPFRSMWAISTRITIPVEWPWLRCERSECHVPYVPRRVAVTNRDKKMFRWKACSGIYIMRVNHGKPVNEKAINLACDIDIDIYQEGFLKHDPLWGSRCWFCLIYHMTSLRFTCSQLWSIDEHWWKQHVTQQYVDSYLWNRKKRPFPVWKWVLTGIPPTWPLDRFQTPMTGHSSADAAELAHGHNVDNTF